MRRPARSKDLSAAEFKALLRAEGFVFNRPTDGFIDLQRPTSIRFQRRVAIRAANGRIQRRETLEMLRRVRAEEQAEAARLIEAKARTERLIATLAPSALVAPRAGLAGSEAVRRMADDMRQVAAAAGGITEDDLVALGFTRAQVRTLADDARTLAQQLSGASL
ncbi:hypothetical protein [Bradyrhizobium sp. SZCCHNRI2049]|uniref:hypothetical protein n=1 Tax=Bradyrhizobium sp. SZCCHNRI2049 TaxID=3057287 RepID=UPI002915E0F8|nr:hypothetical protein [Bradyrhizobium sp. SZCCHNRI2049]